MKIQRLVEDIWIGKEPHLLTISHDIVSLLHIYLLDGADRPSTWSNVLGGGSASIGLINAIDPVVHIHDHETIGHLVHEHNVVAKSQLTVMAIGVGHPLETLSELLLSLIDHQLALILLVQVISLLVLAHVELLRPVAHTGLASVLGAS